MRQREKDRYSYSIVIVIGERCQTGVGGRSTKKEVSTVTLYSLGPARNQCKSHRSLGPLVLGSNSCRITEVVIFVVILAAVDLVNCC